MADRVQDVTVTGIAAGPGGWVAIGGTRDQRGTIAPIWRSSDGRSWSLAERPAQLARVDGEPPQSLVALSATSHQYLALEASTAQISNTQEHVDGQPQVAVWYSYDGNWWARAPVDGSLGASVVATPSGDMVTTDRYDDMSPDGVSWQPVAPADGTEPTGQLLALGDSVVSVSEDGGQAIITKTHLDAAGVNQGNTLYSDSIVPPASLTSDSGAEDAGVIMGATDGRTLMIGRAQRHQYLIYVGNGQGGWTHTDTSAIGGARRDDAETIRSVASGHGRVVAVGAMLQRDRQTGGQGSAIQARAWVSLGSNVWTRAALPTGVVDLTSVTDTPSGFFAVGTNQRGPAFLTSSDGVTWRRSGERPTGDLLGLLPAAVVAQGRRLVVAGLDPGDRPGIWWSDDGQTWRPSTVPDPLLPELWRGLCTDGRTIAAVGVGEIRAIPQLPTSFPQEVAEALTSGDGATWHRAPAPLLGPDTPINGAMRLSACAFGQGGRMVSIGTTDLADTDEAALAVVWPSLATPPRLTLMDGSSPPFSGQLARSIVWTGASFVVGGDSGELDPIEADPVLWSSTDGSIWHRLPAATAPQNDSLSGDLPALTVSGSHLLAAGNDDDGALVLEGTLAQAG
jgi:hypothetical protein